jgi:putative ABC transport system permease protein
MLRELRFAVRMLLKRPGFSLIAILTLALGIGATAAVFSLIQGVLLTPPPYKKPEQLVLLSEARTDGRKMDGPRAWPAEQWTEWQEEAKSFEGIAAYNWTFNFLIRGDGSQSMQGMFVTKDYMPVMGLKTIAGRGFEDSDFSLGPTKAILLGYEFWRRSFNGDLQIIGKTVRIRRWDVPPTVIGVMPPGGTLSSVAGGCERAKLQRECNGGFLGSCYARPEADEGCLLGRRGARARGNAAATSTERISLAGSKRRASRSAV